MFKLDFFEYYMLIERALVHLLGVFGVDIPRGGVAYHERQQQQQQQQRPQPGEEEVEREREREREEEDGRKGDKNNHKGGLASSVWRDEGGHQHRYHANVLAALDSEENPLHGTLGSGEVRVQLGRAKQLRNRWKTAGDEDELGHDHHHHHHHSQGSRSPTKSGGAASPEREWRTRKVAAPLDSYRLEHMLEVIFHGFDEAFKVAERYVRGGGEDYAGEADMEMLEVVDWAAAGDGEDQWEFMVEAMDWEAV